MKNETKTTDTEEINGFAKKTGKPLYGKTDEELLTKDPTNTQQIEKIEIENTPFTAVKYGDKWFLAMGKYRLTKADLTKDEALAEGVNESWWRIMQVVKIMIEEHEKEKGKVEPNTELEGIISKIKTIG